MFISITIAVIICVLMINLFVVLKFKKKLYNNLSVLQQETLKVKRDIKAIGAGTIGVGSRLSNLELYLDNLAIRQEQAELKSSPVSSYSHATKMVAMGASVEDVIASCGLTKAEAELVVMLHAKSVGESKRNEQ